MMKKVLFICTHNSARSQLAEGLVNHYFSDTWKAYSAGTEKTFVKPHAIAAMKDAGIDISHHTSKLLDDFLEKKLDLVVTVCDSAKESCPFFPNTATQIHAGFEDPSDKGTTDEEKLQAFVNTRNEIKQWLDENLKKY